MKFTGKPDAGNPHVRFDEGEGNASLLYRLSAANPFYDMRLDSYDSTAFDRGRPAWVEAVWHVVQSLFVKSAIPGALQRGLLLRLFGGKIGKNVNLKPGLQVKFPWRLEIGDNSWIGENVWIDNLALVRIGSNCCVSQGVYLCTGNHDHSKESFDLITKPIVLESSVWLCAKSVVGPGVTAREGAVLSLGAVATEELEPWTIYQGNPAKPVSMRKKFD